MKKNILYRFSLPFTLLLLLNSNALTGYAQTPVGYLFAKGISGSQDENSQGIAVDANGYIYITGNFLSTVDFDPSGSAANLTTTGSNDVFLAKYTSSGAFQWANKMGSTGVDISQSIAVDGNGNSYITGYFSGVADFDPSGSTANLTSAGGYDVFLAKYNSSGTYLWAKNFGGTSSDIGFSVKVDGNNNVYVTGNFLGTVDFDPGAGTAIEGSWGSSDIFFSKFNSAGAFVWAKTIGSINGDLGYDLAVDGSGNVHITGYYGGTADFDTGPGTINLSTLSGNRDIFFAKYDSNGDYIWAKGIGSSTTDQSKKIVLDGSGNIYITGFFSGTMDFDPGAGSTSLSSIGGDDIFFAKYNSAGVFAWAKTIGSSSNDQGNSITLDGNNNVYITGYFQGLTNFDPLGSSNLTPVGSYDLYFAKYDVAGNYLWARNIGDNLGDEAYDIKVDGSNNVHLTGYFKSTVDFDPGIGTANLTASNTDVFFAKYYQCGLSLTPGHTDVSCFSGNNGTASVTVSGGPAPYTYLWSNNTSTSQISNLTALTYTVLATDGNGCTATSSITINQPPALTVTVVPSQVQCYGGSTGNIGLTVSGGTSPYTYLWSTNSTLPIISNLAAGNYSFTVTDNKLCSVSQTVSITQPAALTVSFSVSNVSCFGGSNGAVDVSISGGTTPYSYSWSPGGATTQDISNLAINNYSLNVTDANACTAFINAAVLNSISLVPICLVTVDSVTYDKNMIVWEKPITTAIDSFRIYRNISSVMTRIGAQSYSVVTAFVDNTPGVSPKTQAHEYAISIVDSCGNESALSPTHITIHQLNPVYSPPSTYDLVWSDYQGFPFADYEIWRDSTDNDKWEKIGLVPFSLSTTYSDLNAPTDSVRYRIAAVPSQPCVATVKNPDPLAKTVKSSKSNSSDKIGSPNSISEISDYVWLSIYPNPSSGAFTIQMDNGQWLMVNGITSTIKIYNVLGELQHQTNVKGQKTEITIPDIANGIYQLQINSRSGTVNRKIVIFR